MIGGTLFRRFFVRFLIGLGIASLVFTALMHLFMVRVVDSEWRDELQQEAEWLARHTHASASGILANAWKQMHSSVRVIFYDVDGKRYIDYVLSWGPLILGHGHPAVVEAEHPLRVGVGG